MLAAGRAGNSNIPGVARLMRRAGFRHITAVGVCRPGSKQGPAHIVHRNRNKGPQREPFIGFHAPPMHVLQAESYHPGR